MTFDPIAAGLKHMGARPAGIPERDFTAQPLRPGWQRVGWRVVSAKIPEPIEYEAPDWAQPRCVVASNGKVYDYETRRHMRPFGVTRTITK